ncbi:MAG: PRC-barrel domain-containing protein [Porticoccus sp.]|nr:PRC-barrel domain-containing protein [Porticoccus sp.]
MLRSMKDLQDYAIHATDGNIGHVVNFYFDDESWVIRYLVVNTAAWLTTDNKVLISPMAIDQPNWAKKVLPVSITKQQVQHSPPIDTGKPVSRQHEIKYLRYFGYPIYWGDLGLWGAGAFSGYRIPGFGDSTPAPHTDRLDREAAYEQADAAAQSDDDTHLRSCKAVLNYHIMANDGDIGHVQDMLVDEETWAIRYLVVNTSNWWLGHQVLVSPQWIKEISWASATVSVDMSRQTVKDAPHYDSITQLNRKEEMSIHAHYGYPPYWV